MNMEEALLLRCEEYEALCPALVARDNLSWEKRPQGGGYPAITFQVISNPRDQHMKGFQRLQRTRCQADVWAKSYSEKKAVTEALIAAVVPAGIFHGVYFRRAMIAFDGDRPAGTADGEPFIHRRQIDFLILHSQA